MTAPAAFKATYADLKLIKGRKTAQFVFEVPIELADEAMKVLGGVPRPDAETWVGIALLRPEKAALPEPVPYKERRAFSDLPLPQQVALRCNDKQFWEFVNHQAFGDGASAETVAVYVRKYCEVNSRSEIRPGSYAAKKWKQLDDAFWFFKRGE